MPTRLLGVIVLMAVPAAAIAQETRPVGPFVVDTRVSLARYGKDPTLAASQGLTVERLPAGGLGVEIGAHVYPLSLGKARLGLGASVTWSRGRKTPVVLPGEPAGEQVEARLAFYASQLSLNFGKRDGWSYISGGLGWTTREYRLAGTASTSTTEVTPKISTINYGGGARWFAKKHFAYTFDLRSLSDGSADGDGWKRRVRDSPHDAAGVEHRDIFQIRGQGDRGQDRGTGDGRQR